MLQEYIKQYSRLYNGDYTVSDSDGDWIIEFKHNDSVALTAKIRKLKTFFSVESTVRKDKKTKEVQPAKVVSYKGMALVLFVGDNLDEKVSNYLEVYGYLAEWRYQNSTKKHFVNWCDTLNVDINE